MLISTDVNIKTSFIRINDITEHYRRCNGRGGGAVKPQMVNDIKTVMMIFNVCSFHACLSNISSFVGTALVSSSTQLSSAGGGDIDHRIRVLRTSRLLCTIRFLSHACFSASAKLRLFHRILRFHWIFTSHSSAPICMFKNGHKETKLM